MSIKYFYTHYVFANFEEILKRYATAQTKYAAFFSFGMLMRIIIWFILSQGFEDEGSKKMMLSERRIWVNCQ